jgi:glycerophosphoryl diester phosphodiesterase
MRTRVLTHRGLDPSRSAYFAESSREAFADQLAREFGLEFDLRVTGDDGLIVIHDGSLTRISGGADNRKISEIQLVEILAMDFNGSHLADFSYLLRLIREMQPKDALSALHLKYESQGRHTLDLMLATLEMGDPERFIIFDAKIETARYLKHCNPALHIAPSVAHPSDVARYNTATGGTLYTLNEIILHRDLFDWVWLDEWDLPAPGDGVKRLYGKATFDTLRAAGFSIGLVSPELHASSPGLLGNEAHPEARDMATLTEAMKRIITLGPDLICTDYPDLARALADGV